MKKLLLLIVGLCFVANMQTSALAEDSPEYPIMPISSVEEVVSNVTCNKELRRDYLFIRLNLTQEQIVKADKLRTQNIEKVQPLIKSLEDKMQEGKMVKFSRMAVRMQEEKLAQIDKDIIKIRKKIYSVQKHNLDKFENMLDKQQRKSFKQFERNCSKMILPCSCIML